MSKHFGVTWPVIPNFKMNETRSSQDRREEEQGVWGVLCTFPQQAFMWGIESKKACYWSKDRQLGQRTSVDKPQWDPLNPVQHREVTAEPWAHVTTPVGAGGLDLCHILSTVINFRSTKSWKVKNKMLFILLNKEKWESLLSGEEFPKLRLNNHEGNMIDRIHDKYTYLYERDNI